MGVELLIGQSSRKVEGTDKPEGQSGQCGDFKQDDERAEKKPAAHTNLTARKTIHVKMEVRLHGRRHRDRHGRRASKNSQEKKKTIRNRAFFASQRQNSDTR